MDDFALEVFVNELLQQSELAFEAYAHLYAQAQTPHQVLFDVQAFLAAAACASLILFPRPKRKPADLRDACELRGKELRALLEVPDDSILRSYELRDHFQHFDERLQKWANRPYPKGFADQNVFRGFTHEKAVTQLPVAPEDNLRLYSDQPPTITFMGNQFPLDKIAEALAILKGYILASPDCRLPDPVKNSIRRRWGIRTDL